MIQTKKYDVLVAGEINPDLILSSPGLTPQFGQHEILVEDAALTIGSSSAIFACGAARLGLKVAFVGVAGRDQFGEFMLTSLRKRGVDISHVILDENLKTGLSVILNRGTDRAILTYLGGIAALRADQVKDSLLEECRHLHVAGYFLQDGLRPGLPDLFVRAGSYGLSTSLDTNWDPMEKWEGLQQVLPLTDVFLPNESEILSLTRKKTLEEALRELSAMGILAAAKLGPLGAAACKSTEIVRVPSIQISPIADTVGAGDSFDAGFVYGYLQGWDLSRTLKLASACGSLSLRKHGGTEAQPDLEEALQAAQLV